MKLTAGLMPLTFVLLAGGCISVKTENEIKPIHITMDVNLKLDRELDKVFSDEDKNKPSGNFKAVRDAMNRKVVGLTSMALLEARSGATDADRILVAEENVRRLKRFRDIAVASGVSVESVQKRRAAKIRDRLPAGSGIWYQNDAGNWCSK